MVMCHGKFYAAVVHPDWNTPAQIVELIVDDTYATLEQKVIVTVPEPYTAVLGLQCDPRDHDENFKLYFAASVMYHQDGLWPVSPYPYLSKVSFKHNQNQNVTCTRTQQRELHIQ